MHECEGSIPVTAKVDSEMRESLDDDAEALGLYRADVIREALCQYVDLRRADFECPHCHNEVQIQP